MFSSRQKSSILTFKNYWPVIKRYSNLLQSFTHRDTTAKALKTPKIVHKKVFMILLDPPLGLETETVHKTHFQTNWCVKLR